MEIINKIKARWMMLLLSVISAELLVLFIPAMNKNILMMVSQSSGVSIYKWFYSYVGPVLFPLIGLTLLYFHILIRLIQIYRSNCDTESYTKPFSTLKLIEVTAPAFGFLGTTLSLVNVMAGIDPGLSQSGMLKSLLNNSASAFGSTIFGIVLSITAYLTSEMFRNFLLLPEKENEIPEET